MKKFSYNDCSGRSKTQKKKSSDQVYLSPPVRSRRRLEQTDHKYFGTRPVNDANTHRSAFRYDSDSQDFLNNILIQKDFDMFPLTIRIKVDKNMKRINVV